MTVYAILKDQYEKEIQELKRQLSLANSRKHEIHTHSTKTLQENDRLKAQNTDLTSRLQKVQQCAQCTVINEFLLPIKEVDDRLVKADGDDVSKHPSNLRECIAGYRKQILHQQSYVKECESRLGDRDVVISSLQERVNQLEQYATSIEEQLKNSVPNIPENMDVRPILVSQLEKATATINAQNVELELLRIERANLLNKDREVENLALRTQLLEMQTNFRNNQSHLAAQEEFLAEIQMKLDEVSADRVKWKDKYHNLETKYKQVQSAHKQLTLRMENEMTSLVGTLHPVNGSPLRADQSSNILDEARMRHTEHSENVSQSNRLQSLKHDIEELRDRVVASESELEKERNRATSLHEDLAALRKAMIEKNAEVEHLLRERSDMEIHIQKIETQYTNLLANFEEERAQSEAWKAAYFKCEVVAETSANESFQLQSEINRLNGIICDKERQVVACNSRLHAQGQDLIATKRRLHNLESKLKQGVSVRSLTDPRDQRVDRFAEDPNDGRRLNEVQQNSRYSHSDTASSTPIFRVSHSRMNHTTSDSQIAQREYYETTVGDASRTASQLANEIARLDLPLNSSTPKTTKVSYSTYVLSP